MFVTSELTQLAAEATSWWVNRHLNVLPVCQHRNISEMPEPTLAVNWASIYEQGFTLLTRSNQQNRSHTKSLILSHEPSRVYMVFSITTQTVQQWVWRWNFHLSTLSNSVCSWSSTASYNQHLLCMFHLSFTEILTSYMLSNRIWA